MLPFISDWQAKRVRQDFSITEDAWNGRRELIGAEHRAETARTELVQFGKRQLISKGGAAGIRVVLIITNFSEISLAELTGDK